MSYNLRKTTGYLSIIALLNGSYAPLYAQGGNLHSDIEDGANRSRHISRQKPSTSMEDRGQQFVASVADRIASWIPQGVKSYLTTLGEETTSLVNGKTPMEVDYSNSTFWQALFETELEAVKAKPTPDGLEALKEFKGVVLEGLLSPRIYEEAFQYLQSQKAQGFGRKAQKSFKRALRKDPELLKAHFYKDLLETFDSEESLEGFEAVCAYYKGLQSSLDHTEVLFDILGLLKKHKDNFNLSRSGFVKLSRPVAKALRSYKEELSAIKAQRREEKENLNPLKHLPFYNEDELPETFNSSLPPKPEEYKDEFSALDAVVLGVAGSIYKGMKFAINNPGKAITLGLMAQAGVAAAMSAFSVPSAKRMGAQKPRPEEERHHFPKRAIGDEFQINQVITADQYAPSVAVLPGGNAFTVWPGQQVGNWDVYGRFFSPNGTALANELQINQVTTADQYAPSVTALSNGNAFVAWHGDQTGNLDIYGRLLSPNGTTLTNEFQINQITTGNQANPSVAALPNGNAFVTWYGYQTGNYDIYGRIFSPSGSALTGELSINQVTTGDQYDPSVAALPNGNAFITWRGNQAGDYDILGRLFFPNGTSLTNEFAINQVTTGGQYDPSVAALFNGNTFVVWRGDQTGNDDIYGRILSPSGNALTGEFQINQNTTGIQTHPSVSVLSNGNAFVAWRGDQTGDANIYARLLSPNGSVLTDEFQINQITTGDQDYPSVSAYPNGNVLLAWQADQTGNYDIYGRILTADYLDSLIPPSPAVPLPAPGVIPPSSPPETPPVFLPVSIPTAGPAPVPTLMPTPMPTPLPVPVPQTPLPEALPPSVPPIAPIMLPSAPPIELPMLNQPHAPETIPMAQTPPLNSDLPIPVIVGGSVAALGAIGLCAGGTWCVVNHKKKKKKTSQNIPMSEYSTFPHGQTSQSNDVHLSVHQTNYVPIPGKDDAMFLQGESAVQPKGVPASTIYTGLSGQPPQGSAGNYANLPNARIKNLQSEYDKFDTLDISKDE